MIQSGFKFDDEVKAGRCIIRHFKSGRLIREAEINRMELEQPVLHFKLGLMLRAMALEVAPMLPEQTLLRQFDPSEAQAKYEVEYGHYRWLA